MKKIGVVLGGCGVYDGSEIHEAVITLLAITGLSHRQAYGGIFAITVIKSLAVLFVIATFYVTGIV